ncbi:hypothetical protein [Methylomonas sp. MgM2]
MRKSLFIEKRYLPICVFGLLGLVGQASANVMYNTYNQYASNIGTDGDGDDGYTRSDYGTGEPVAWVGTDEGHLPFGLNYRELRFANWAVNLEAVGKTESVSSQNAHDSYAVWADIDTSPGGWFDGEIGTMYSMDLGLIKSDLTQQVTLTVSNIDPLSWQNFGITVYSGADQLHPKTVYEYSHDECCDADGNPVPVYDYVDYNYLSTMSHYGYWNSNYFPEAHQPAQKDDPFGSDHIFYLTHGDQSTVTFTAQEGEIYVVLLGGNSGGDRYKSSMGYTLDVASSPVPIPGAVWFFGSVLGLFSYFQRRKRL